VLTVMVYMYYTVHKHHKNVNNIVLVLKQVYCTYTLALKLVISSRELVRVRVRVCACVRARARVCMCVIPRKVCHLSDLIYMLWKERRKEEKER